MELTKKEKIIIKKCLDYSEEEALKIVKGIYCPDYFNAEQLRILKELSIDKQLNIENGNKI